MLNTNAKAQLLFSSQCTLAEGPVYIANDDALLWVDIKRKNLHRLALGDLRHTTVSFAEEITSIFPRRAGGYIASLRNNFAFLNPDFSIQQILPTPESTLSSNRFNDGKIDAHGNYWVGSMDDNEGNASGKLYCLSKNGVIKTLDEPYIITNGPTFSPDGQFVYHTDTLSRTIYQFQLDPYALTITGKKTFAQFSENDGYPDGITTDSEGNIWVCHFFGGKLSVINRRGERIAEFRLPTSNVTNCTFGGKYLDTLFITTAKWRLDSEQQKLNIFSGDIFVLKPGVRGMAQSLFG